MQTFINILVFIIVLGSIILIHELGHFIAAKLFGVYCGEFSKKVKQNIIFVPYRLAVMWLWPAKLIRKIMRV